MNNVLKNKGTSLWIIISVLVIAAIVVIVSGRNAVDEKKYQFPLTTEDIEGVLAEQGISMYVEDSSTIDDSINFPDVKNNITTLKNDDNVTFGISSQVRNNHRLLNLIWYLPKTLSSEQVDEFFHNELPKQFDLAGIFYGNKKGLDKELNKLLEYYLDEKNYNNSSYWNKRVGNDHLRVSRNNRTMSTISMMIIPNEIYEDYLSATNELWKENAKAENTKIYEGTIAEMEKTAREDIPGENKSDAVKHFVIKGHLKNIKENKIIPEKLADIESNYLMPNKEKYLSAKLVDDTGSIDVFLQMTSLKPNELSKDRNHDVVILYSNGEPIYVVRSSTLN
ncbi:hypothetical protein [Sedimentibacter sp.]|uniref:hypothetical protein n=1 Tax=Sedimentibacter sp. TaxID=1960295 RepID=UPI00289F8927|nr:hypothetical protein [Sedimentibacter sp.]